MTTEGITPGLLAQVACLLEVGARKPGNVHFGRGFEDAIALDFLLGAAAIAGPIDRARGEGVGAAVLAAVEATRRLTTTNTHLGTILLLAPLAAVPDGIPLAEGISTVLEATTVEDARLVYRAIRLANPGGLGTVASQDVAGEPTLTLRETMYLAAQRDLVARQYANTFTDLFKLALPELRGRLEAGYPLETAIVSAHLQVLSNCPDTLIARKCGVATARAASLRAAAVLAAGWPDAPESWTLRQALDDWLREDGHSRNPGATADLLAATLFAALRDGTIPLPRPSGPLPWADPG